MYLPHASRPLRLLALTVASSCATLAIAALSPAHAFTLTPQQDLVPPVPASSPSLTSSPTPVEDAGESVSRTAPQKNEYAKLVNALDNFNFASDGVACAIDDFISFTGFVICDDHISNGVVDSLNSFLTGDTRESSSSGFTSLKEGLGRNEAAIKISEADQPRANAIAQGTAGPSYAELQSLKRTDEPPPLLLVLGASFGSVFLVSRLVR